MIYNYLVKNILEYKGDQLRSPISIIDLLHRISLMIYE